MAQLRDARTSNLIAVGDPRDLIVIADELGADRVLWDDVGAVDVDALRRANAERLEYLEGDAAAAEAGRQQAAREATDAVERVLRSIADPEREVLEPIDVGGWG
jgi:hypothetical protein